MKAIQIFIALFVPIFFTATAKAPEHFEKATFKVYGNCSMCKKTIESALLKNPNIKRANWNVDTKMIEVEYNPHSISLDEVHHLIANSGYDTDKVKAPEAAYKKLPGCCQYERAK